MGKFGPFSLTRPTVLVILLGEILTPFMSVGSWVVMSTLEDKPNSAPIKLNSKSPSTSMVQFLWGIDSGLACIFTNFYFQVMPVQCPEGQRKRVGNLSSDVYPSICLSRIRKKS